MIIYAKLQSSRVRHQYGIFGGKSQTSFTRNATRAGSEEGWLFSQARWSHLSRSGLPAVSRKQNYSESHIINPLLTKFARSRWLGFGLVLFCEFMDLDFVSVHKHAKKELGQYPAILTSHLVNNPDIFPCHRSLPLLIFSVLMNN